MERAQGDDQCQHPGCKCPRPATGDYCSDHCANAQKGDLRLWMPTPAKDKAAMPTSEAPPAPNKAAAARPSPVTTKHKIRRAR